MVNQSLRGNTFGQQLPTYPIIPIFTNTIEGDQVVNVPGTIASTMHTTSVTTVGEILPDFYLPGMLNSCLSEVLFQEDDNLSCDGNQVAVLLLNNLLPAYQTDHYSVNRKNGKIYAMTDHG